MSELSLAERLSRYATPTLYEASTRVVALAPTIKPLYVPIQLSGPAFTVLAAPGDNAAVHWALAEAPPGSVLVAATGGEGTCAIWGEIMMEAALARGIRGLVTDGAVRDTRAIRRRSFPVFCAGTAIAGPAKAWRGVMNQPVVLGRALVRPGDIVVGDDDGVVVVPPEEAADALARADARVDREATYVERLRQGHLTLDLLGLREADGDRPEML